MGIAKLKPDAQPAFETTVPAVPNEPTKSNFTTLTPEVRLNSLLKYVEGHPWPVNYYGHILNSDNTIELFDPDAPNFTQPFYEVRDMIIQVSSPLTNNYNEQQGTMTTTGSAIMPFQIKPNVGDIIVANVDSGEDAIFHIKAVRRATHRKGSLYEVDYTLHSYLSEEPNYLVVLQNRVNETYYYNKDTNYFNRDVLIKPSVKEARERISVFLAESMNHYTSIFVNRKIGSLAVPGTQDIMYDPILVRFLFRTQDLSGPQGNNIFQHVYVSDELDQNSILDCMVTRTKPHPRTMNPKYHFIRSSALPIRSKLGTLSLAGIQDVLYPKNPNLEHKSGYFAEVSLDSVTSPITANNHYELPDIVVETTNNNNVFAIPLLHPLFNDDTYIVTDNFYDYINGDDTAAISYIELLMAKFFRGESIHPEDLAIAVERYQDWSVLHKFYLLPVLWLLIKVNI